MMKWVLVAAVFCASVEQGAAPVCRTIQSDRMDIPMYYVTRQTCVDAVRGELEKTVASMNEAVGYKLVHRWNFNAACARVNDERQ